MPAILTTVFVTPRSTLLYGAQGSNPSPIQIVNLDNTNTVYLATTSNPTPGQPGTFPLAPLASLSFDGSVSIYGITNVGQNVIAGVVPTGQGYSPGALAISGPVTATISGPVTVNGNVGITGTPNVNVANTPNVNIGNTGSVSILGTPNVNVANTPSVNIGSSGTVAVSSVSGTIDVTGSSVDITAGNVNATGVGGFIKPGDTTVLYSNTTNQAIAPNSSLLPFISPVDVSNYNSYDISICVSDTSMATLGHAHAYKIILNWYDDLVTSIPVFTEVWCPWVSNTANASLASGTGPMHGKYMTVAIFNYNGVVGNITVNSLLIFGSGRTNTQSDWRQDGLLSHVSDNTFSVLNNTAIATDNMIADTNGMPTLAASHNYFMPLALFAGPADWGLQTGAGLIITKLNIVNVGSNGGSQTSGNLTANSNSLEVLPTTAGTNSAGSQTLPRSACALMITTGGTGGTFEFTMSATQSP